MGAASGAEFGRIDADDADMATVAEDQGVAVDDGPDLHAFVDAVGRTICPGRLETEGEHDAGQPAAAPNANGGGSSPTHPRCHPCARQGYGSYFFIPYF